MSTASACTASDQLIESCLKQWRDKILIDHKRKDLTAADLASLFQQQDLQKAFFKIIDRDCNGCLSLEEWTGCFSKLLDEKNDTQLLSWFVEKFYAYCNIHETTYLNEKDFETIVSDIEFGYRLASLICPKSRRIKTIQLISSLEIIASLSTDAKWLSWLKYQFTEAMNKKLDVQNEMHVTLNDFVENFYFKEPFLAHRLFTYLDKDKSGYLSLREFINGLEIVVNGSQEEKMQFLFRVFDVDGNGRIDLDELKMMLRCCLEDSPSLDLEETVDDLSSLLFKNLVKDDSADISFDELKTAFKEHYDLYKSLSMSTSIWIKPKFVQESKQTVLSRFKHFIQNKQATLFFWSFYTLIHLACMLNAYLQYSKENIYVQIARMFGNSLNFNCSLILVLVLRKHLTWLRIKGGNNLLPIDDFIQIHKIIGIVILIETLIHTIAHLINVAVKYEKNTSEALSVLFTLKVSKGYTTGIIETIILIVIIVFASSYVRKRGHFELFYLAHMLTIPWLLIMLLHAPNFWKWLLLPGLCYTIEKVLRYRKIRSNKFGDTFIMESYVLPSKVTHLVIRKPSKFHFKPGDYIYINIPIVAHYEWHPFSISSAPENSDFLWLHIKSAGNWTKKLYSYSQSSKFDNANVSQTSQKSIIRVNMRTKMSNLISTAAESAGTLFNENDGAHSHSPNVFFSDQQQLHNKHHKAVSFVPQSSDDDYQQQEQEQQKQLNNQVNLSNHEQINLSKISGRPNLNEQEETNQTPKNQNLSKNNNGSSGLSVVPQSIRSNKGEPSLRHKSILKVMAQNIKSSSIHHHNHNQPTESTPRSLMNINMAGIEQDSLREPTPTGGTGASECRNRSKSLDNPNENSFYNTCYLTSDQLTVRISNQTKSESMNLLKTRLDYFTDNNNISTNNNNKDELDDLSKNNLVLSYENNLTTPLAPPSETVALIETQIATCAITTSIDDENNDCDNACFLNMAVDDDDDQEVVVKTSYNYNHHNSILDTNKTFNNLNKSVTSLYNRLKQQFNVTATVQPADTLGYLKMYNKANRVNINTMSTDDAWRLKVHIDGPYGTPNNEIFDSDHAVLVAAGIGITPFASILQSIMNKYRQAKAKCPNCDHKLSEDLLQSSEKLTIKKVDFIWVTRDQRSLEWFISILSQMEIEQSKNNDTFLETHLYVTSAKRQSDLRAVSLQITLDAIFSQEESSHIDGLRKRTHHGRPNWDIVLQNLIRKQKGKINVFYCGLPSLGNVLQQKCKEYDLTFKKEIF